MGLGVVEGLGLNGACVSLFKNYNPEVKDLEKFEKFLRVQG